VPLSALRDEQGRQVVWTIEGNKIVARPVTVGMRNEDEGFAQVNAGLDKGASVIVARLDGVKPGNKVRVGAAPAPAASPTPSASSAPAAASASSATAAATKG
jgi:multidrug efflux pump subunit AcrA (membrane-fusion protein)